MCIAFIAVVFAGFARTFYLRPYFQSQPLIPLLHLHGALFSSWIVLLFAQTSLVAAGRTDIHRRLGIAGGVLAALMVVVGTITGIVRTKPDDLAFLTVPLGDMLVFGTLAGAAFWFRRKIDVHKRLIMLATIAVLPAAVARLPLGFIQKGGLLLTFGLADLFIVPLVVHDVITRGRPHRATVIGGAFLVISHPLREIVGQTHAWLSFAQWLTGS
jgi:FtsH-binding integral membrane protein